MNSDLNPRLTALETEIIEIKSRNQRVESEKAWETSTTRKIAIVVITYVLMTCVFWSMGVTEPLKNSIIPTLGYFLSTQSLPLVKRWWIKQR